MRQQLQGSADKVGARALPDGELPEHGDIIRRPEVERTTGLSRSTLYELMSREPPEFPRPVPLSGRSVGWLRSEVTAWKQNRIAQRDTRIAGRAA